jgi:murein tripeptide amidase MpaA
MRLAYKFIRFEVMGTSNGGLEIPILKITNKPKRDNQEEKPVILIIGRQHSGETHSSFIIHGFINFLVSREALCEKMRDRFEFWIAPIVNPDGVVCGNYRCNTQGKDPNRFFFADDDPEGNKIRLTEVELIRTYLKNNMPKGEDKFKLFLDIHAHSAMTSIFVFCPQVEDPDE